MELAQTGGCQCDGVRYEITQAPDMVYTCHCTDCQRMTSSAFSLGCVLPDGAFRLAQGEPKGVQRMTGSGRVSTRWVCRTAACGSAPRRGPARRCATCEAVPWTTPRGCGRPRTSGPAASSPGSRYRRGIGSSRRSPQATHGGVPSFQPAEPRVTLNRRNLIVDRSPTGSAAPSRPSVRTLTEGKGSATRSTAAVQDRRAVEQASRRRASQVMALAGGRAKRLGSRPLGARSNPASSSEESRRKTLNHVDKGKWS
jgi:hypothetical protein